MTCWCISLAQAGLVERSHRLPYSAAIWDDLKLSFGSFIPLCDMTLTTQQLNLFTFFFFVSKSGKRISMLNDCRNKSFTPQEFWRPAP